MFDFSSPQGRNATLFLYPTTGQPAPSPQADLQVQVSAPLFAAKGQPVRANVTVANHGPTTARPLQIVLAAICRRPRPRMRRCTQPVPIG